MKSRLTTGRGDGGETTALSGDSLSKGHGAIECVGALDEVRAHTALLRLLLVEDDAAKHGGTAEFLLWLLHVYFVLGTECSDPARKHPEYRKAELTQGHLDRLEGEQLRIEAEVSLPEGFVVGATCRLSAEADLTCTVARRFERSLVRLSEATPEFEAGLFLAFVNRLSDYLFILARQLEQGRHLAVDYTRLHDEK